MLRNLIVLPDGTELYSGDNEYNNVRSASIKQLANSGTELTLGSVCTSILDAALQTPNGGVNITAGSEISFYKVDDAGTRTKVGLFTLETPTRSSAHTYKFTAYDRVSWLDRDLTSWLASLDIWPCRLDTFAQLVCEACGVVLVTTDIPNGDFTIQRFTANVTGRQLMQWIGEACGRFCRANADGAIEFAWYTETDVEVTPSGDLYIFTGSLTYEDYQVAPVEKVQIRFTDDDIGVVYPDDANALNTYAITGNYLLMGSDSGALTAVAQNLYEQLSAVTYTPCKVSIPASLDVHAGDIVKVTDRNGISFTTYIMTRTQKGQKDTLESTGSARRDSSSVVNNETLRSVKGKVLAIQKTVEGITVRNEDLEGKYSELQLNTDAITAEVSRTTQEMEVVKESMTTIEQTAGSVEIRVTDIEENGATKVKTEMGYTFDDQGLGIAKEGDEIKNLVDNKGLKVTRGGEIVFSAGADGVTAPDVKVTNYLEVGNLIIEGYTSTSGEERTAFRWR